MRYLYLICLTFISISLHAQAPAGPTEPSSKDELGVQLPLSSNGMTITESSQIEALTEQDIGANYDLGKISNALSEALENDAVSHNTAKRNDARIHLRDVLIGFILEVVLTIIVLAIAFSLSGFPYLFHQIALLGIATALVGAALEYFLFIGLLNPIRIGLSFILLLILIRQFTDVREWSTAIRITLVARLISLGLMWAAFAGVMMAFGL